MCHAAAAAAFRLAILYQDWHGVKKLLVRAKTICEAGGDWEHKNKLKVRFGGCIISNAFLLCDWLQLLWCGVQMVVGFGSTKTSSR
jgi:hypothetical protein